MSDAPAWRPTRLVLVRHGESNVTVRRVIGGPRTCDGLSELGHRQAEALATRLRDTGELTIDALYSSAYPRARETAEYLADVEGLTVRIDDGLGEHDPGPDCDGMSFVEFVEVHGMPNWEDDPHATTFPGGETVAEFHHRVGATIHRLVQRHTGGVIVAVCHGGVIDAVLRHALRAASTGVFEVHTKNASLTELVHVGPGRWRLVRYNDAAHLHGLPAETPRSDTVAVTGADASGDT